MTYYDSWKNSLTTKRSELSLVANWASMVQLGRCRDYCRMAMAEIDAEIARCDTMEAALSRKDDH